MMRTTEPMRVLVLHNFYRSENASGENLSVADEVTGLRELGWDVEFVTSDSDVITDGDISLAELAVRPIYSRRSVRRVRDAAHRFRPHVALVENLFPLHSPWVIRTLRDAGIPVAAGVRSYRMWCAKSTLYRNGSICRDCTSSAANIPAIRHGCYQDSPLQTVPMATSLAVHRSTFRSVDALLAVSEFVRDELIRAGFDPARIVVRPNFVADPGDPAADAGDGYLFAGRLTHDKGVAEMIAGWQRSEVWRHSTLRIAGSGPLRGLLDDVPAEHAVRPLGLLPHGDLMNHVTDSAVSVVPSLWPEPFGRGVIEAAARGRPSIVTRSGGVAGLVEDGTTGWVCEPNVDGIASGFRRALDPAAQAAFGRAARHRYLERYTRETSLGVLDATLRRLAHRGLDLT